MQTTHPEFDHGTKPLREPADRRLIPFFVPSIGAEEIAAVTEVLRSGWLTKGPKVEQFEYEFCQYVGASHGIAVSSGTQALHLALEALGVGVGDEVLMPTMTFASAAAVVLHLGARPVLVDCDGETLNLNVDDLTRKITAQSKAMMPMHYGGQPCRMDEILNIARHHRIRVVEDAAHALSAEYAGQKVGRLGDITCFSFYANKAITTGEGGMITTQDDTLAKRMRLMSYHGIEKNCRTSTGSRRSWCYEVVAAGYKATMNDVAAAIGIHQLARCEDFRAARERCARMYSTALVNVEGIWLPRVLPDSRPAWHLYVIQLDPNHWSISRDELSDRLQSAGIATSVHFMPLHMHPYYRRILGCRHECFPAATAAYERIISLPIFPTLTGEDITYIADTIAALATEFRK